MSLPAGLESARTSPSRMNALTWSSENEPSHASPHSCKGSSSATTSAVFTVGVGVRSMCLPEPGEARISGRVGVGALMGSSSGAAREHRRLEVERVRGQSLLRKVPAILAQGIIEDAAEDVHAHRVAQLGQGGGQEALREQRMGANIGRERAGTGSHTRRERGGAPSGRSA